jgi:hypothetical protein
MPYFLQSVVVCDRKRAIWEFIEDRVGGDRMQVQKKKKRIRQTA